MGTVILWLIVIVVMGLLYRDFLKKKKMEQHRWSNWKICYELFKEKLEQLRGWLFLKLVPPDYYKRSEQLLTLEEIADRIDYFNAEEKKIKNSLDKTKLEEEKVKLSFEAIQKKLFKMRSFYKAIEYSITREHLDYCEYNNEEIIENVNIAEDAFALSPTVKLKLHCMDTRELRKAFNKNDQAIKKLLEEYKSRYTTKTNISIYALMVIALEAELQNVMYNLRYEKLDKSLLDVKAIVLKYEKIASNGNQSIARTISKFIGEIEYLFLEAIKIEYEYYVQKERMKEEQRMLKEQMRQEAAEKKILEEQKKKVEQEEAKFLSELSQVTDLIKATNDPDRIAQLQERFEKVQEQLSQVEKNKEEIINLQNGKAGYVYIISNLGSFGNNIFKVGMTRRLEPQDRIDELGNASVPFRFDVHSFIFSERAPELETAIHKRLHDKRVNKINLRKEFFACSIEELEDLVYSLEPTAEFNKTMLAEQYNQSIAIDYIPESVEIDMLEEEKEEEEVS